MAITESSFPTGRSPLRTHLSRRHQSNISKATSARLCHLQQVATWASLFVPPLGAFLGSHIASTSEMLGSPPLAASHGFICCQRCESVLHIGINCSFRIKSKKLKKQSAVTKGVSTPINTFIYSCKHCAFESVVRGTPKAYVKTKLSEMAAHRKLSEPYQGFSVGRTEKVSPPGKAVSKNIVPSSALLKESPGSTSKRAKRKGWQSLKQLCSSPVEFSPVGSKTVLSMKLGSPFSPLSKKPYSARVMPTVPQSDIKCLLPTFKIGGELCIKAKSMLELSEGDAGADRVLNVSRSLGILGTGLWSDTEVMIPNSRNMDESICSEKTFACTADLLQHSDASGIAMIEDNSLKQKSNIHHIETDDAMLKQLSAPPSVLHHSAEHMISTTEPQCNLPCAVLQTESANVAPISSTQGLRTSEDETCISSSANFDECSSMAVIVKSSDEHLGNQESSSNDKVVIADHSGIVKAVRRKKRKHDDNDYGCIVPQKKEVCKPEANESRFNYLDAKQTSGIKPSSSLKHFDTEIFACERKVMRRTKKKPLFRRFGHHWFTICTPTRRLNWRII